MKKVLITGANRGLGLGFVRYYLSLGYMVVAACRNPENAEDLLHLSKAYPDRIIVEALEVTNESVIIKLTKSLKERDVHLDLLINNAGVCLDEAMEEWITKTFAFTFEVNVIGVALIAKHMASLMHDGAKVIQLSSGRGSILENQGAHDGLDAYSISKAALNMLSRRLATKLQSRDIIVASISPGWVQTDMGGMGADLTVEQSIEIMTKTIDQLTLQNSGRFLATDGSTLDW